MRTYEWKCPKCGANANECGDERKAQDNHSEACMGFICECDGDCNETHGQSLDEPCEEARCYHCGWAGTYPSPPKGMQSWEKKALAAGWRMPHHRQIELGIAEIDLGIGGGRD